jgi:hypothetical protein
MNDLHNLTTCSDYGKWRRREAEELSDIVQSRLHALQVSVKHANYMVHLAGAFLLV